MEGREFRPSRREWRRRIWISPPGGRVIRRERRKNDVLAVLEDFKAVGAQNRWPRTPSSMIGYPKGCRGPHRRLLPIADVCDQGLGPSLRLLPTEGVCDQHVGATRLYRGPNPGLLPTAGVCEHRLGASLRLLPTAGVCNQCLGASLILLPTAGVCEQRLG